MEQGGRVKSAWTLVVLMLAIFVVATLNLYMNVLANSGPSGPLPLDIHMDGVLFGSHSPSEHEGAADESPSSLTQTGEDANVRLALPILLAPHKQPDSVHSVGLSAPLHLTNRTGQTAFVAQLLRSKLESVAPLFRWATIVASSLRSELNRTEPLRPLSAIQLTVIWKSADSLVTEREIFPKSADCSFILDGYRVAAVVTVTGPIRGHLPSQRVWFNFVLSGGRKVIFWPIPMASDRFNNTKDKLTRLVVEAEPVVAFHLAKLLGFRRVPYAVGRHFQLSSKICSTQQSSHLCTTLGSFCRSEDKGVCQQPSKEIVVVTGVIIAALPISLQGNEGGGVFDVANPWAMGTGDTAGPLWQSQPDFCLAVVERLPLLGGNPLYLDQMDLASMDFLLGRSIRPTLRVLNGTHYPLLLFPFGPTEESPERKNPLATLSPLFQCCKLRRTTFETLRTFATQPAYPRLALDLIRSVQSDLLNSYLTADWLVGLQTRLFQLLGVVQLCVDRYGESNVLIVDGFS